MATKILKEDRDAALKELRRMIAVGQTVYTILRHVSRSGMLRIVDPVVSDGGRIRSIGWLVAKATGDSHTTDWGGGLRVGGCGFDAGFQVVYNLGHTLWPNGTDAPHSFRNGEPDSDGGYALKHSWL